MVLLTVDGAAWHCVCRKRRLLEAANHGPARDFQLVVPQPMARESWVFDSAPPWAHGS